jgi:hypothetical protein
MTVALFCFLGFFASTGYFVFLSHRSPSASNFATGQTIQLNNHGDIFYVCSLDAWAAQSGFAFVLAAFVCLGVLRWTNQRKQ